MKHATLALKIVENETLVAGIEKILTKENGSTINPDKVRTNAVLRS